MNRAADGDLTARLNADSESEAMEQIATAFNEMMDEIEATMEEIQSFAEEVSDASEETMAGVNKAEELSEDVTKSIAEIANGADDQREMLEEVSGDEQSLRLSKRSPLPQQPSLIRHERQQTLQRLVKRLLTTLLRASMSPRKLSIPLWKEYRNSTNR